MPTMTFTTEDDSYDVVTAEDFVLSFLAGNDTLTTRNVLATTEADMGEGDDVLFHRGGTADVSGGAGSDRFEVYTAGLTADGGADNDLINIRSGTGLVLRGGLGNDRFNFYNDTSAVTSVLLEGGDGNDDFFGYFRSIGGSLYGQGGDDYFVSFGNFGGNSLTIYGGIGNDIYRAHHLSPGTFVENADEGRDSVQVARGATYILPENIENISVQGFHGSTTGPATLTGNVLANTINGHANVETIFGLDGDDRIAAKGGDDIVWGGNGNDYLDGNTGNDTIHGEAGNDTLQGRTGNDIMVGGDGNDVYYVDSALDQLIEEDGGGTDLVRPSVSYTMSANVENGIISGTASVNLTCNVLANDLSGNSGNNQISGAGGNDIIRGGAGNDTLSGDGEDDILQGGDGNDILLGGDGDDVLVGGNGDDLLVGGSGFDAMTGGDGSDTFAFNAVSDSPFDNPDVIHLFSSVEGTDTLDLSGIDANSTIDGNQAFTNRFAGGPTGTAGELWYTLDANTNVITWYGDVDGDAVADFAVQIDTAPTPGIMWFSDMIL